MNGMYKLHSLPVSHPEAPVPIRPQTDIPATEARERISEVISRVAFGGERIVLSRNGKPQVAVVSLADLERLKRMDPELERARTRALEALAQIQAGSAKNGVAELTDDDVAAEIAAVRRARRSRQTKKAR